MTDLSPDRRAAIRARCDRVLTYPNNYREVEALTRQDVPDLLAALDRAEAERDAMPVIAKSIAEFRKEYGPYTLDVTGIDALRAENTALLAALRHAVYRNHAESAGCDGCGAIRRFIAESDPPALLDAGGTEGA